MTAVDGGYFEVEKDFSLFIFLLDFTFFRLEFGRCFVTSIHLNVSIFIGFDSSADGQST